MTNKKYNCKSVESPFCEDNSFRYFVPASNTSSYLAYPKTHGGTVTNEELEELETQKGKVMRDESEKSLAEKIVEIMQDVRAHHEAITAAWETLFQLFLEHGMEESEASKLASSAAAPKRSHD